MHPFYLQSLSQWKKWRDVYCGGDYFIRSYLQKFSDREGDEDFKKRMLISYNPAFAQQAVDEVKNIIISSLVNVVRRGGSKSYQYSMEHNVDLHHSSMNSFIGNCILPELLPMGKVGVYVDMPELSGNTLLHTNGKHPYLYVYTAEQIHSWEYDYRKSTFTHVLLTENTFDYEDGLPVGTKERSRRMWLTELGVMVQIEEQEPRLVAIPEIPFYVCDLGTSLLRNVDNYQIALLNMASADIAYSLSSNFPFYTEQYDFRANSLHLKPVEEEVATGTNRGRRYPQGMDRPGFIHPSPEPLRASMEKQEQLKREIRELVFTNVESLSDSVETGILSIVTKLESMERAVSRYWSMYENESQASVFYPTSVTLKRTAERVEEAKQLADIAIKIPSPTFQKQAMIQVCKLLIGRNIKLEEMEEIQKEILEAKAGTSDPSTISRAVENGYLDLALAAELMGYPKDTIDKAAVEHAERLSRIAEAQGVHLANPAARGLKDLGGDAKAEKQQVYDTNTEPGRQVRGESDASGSS
jgi:hypothetical protein